MTSNKEYALAERADWEELYSQLRAIRKNPVIQEEVESSRDALLVLNGHRQIVFANQLAREWLKVNDVATIYGCRPGEVMHCKFAEEGKGGCGTSKHCRVCGALNAVLRSITGDLPCARRCKIDTVESAEPLQLIVFSTPLEVASHSLVLLAILEDRPEVISGFSTNFAFGLQRLVKAAERA